MADKVLIAVQDTFTKTGRYVARGNPVSSAEVDYDPETSTNLTEAPKALQGQQPVVEISAIAPTGPNPVNPQQIAPDVVQTTAGYEQQGVRLVGEVTKPEKQRITVVGIDDDKALAAQADVNESLEKGDAERAEIEAAAATDALDHDGDGRKGGSRKRS